MNWLWCFSLLILSLDSYAQRSDFNEVDFSSPDSVAALYPKYPLKDLYGLSQKLTAPFPSDHEKFRAIYKWVSVNIESDYALYKEDRHMRTKLNKDSIALVKWTKAFNGRLNKKLFSEYRTVCLGYAYLIKELSEHAGLSCVVIGGYGRTAQSNIGGIGIPNHAWNAIKLNDKWYLCDATWSSGAINEDASQFVPKFDDAYFLAEPDLFARNHYPLDTTWLLLQNKPTLQQFLSGPLTYTSIYKYQVKNITPENFNLFAARGQEISWWIKVPTGVTVHRLAIQNNQAAKVVKPLIRDNNGQLSIKHTFTSKGVFAFHILINDEYVASYTVNVQ